MNEQLTETDVDTLLSRLAGLRAEVGKVIVGQRETVEHLLVGLLAGGHCLLEGVPGLAKTLMVRTLGDAMHLTFKRVQFTPDLMPSDIVGTEILEEDHGTGRRVFRFQKGPVFAHLLLADEINRSPPKTQAALLEAMQERSVTYGGETYALPRPFFVLATQNPIEQEGTYPLPEAQLDRFLLHLRIGYPSAEEELQVLEATTGERIAEAAPVLGAEEVLLAQSLVRQVHVSRALLRWAVELVRATRPAESRDAKIRDVVDWGAGPRAGQALALAAKGRALLGGRLSVTLDDLRALAPPVLRHRLLVGFRGQAEGVTAESLVSHLLATLPDPQSPLD
ncbi:MAG TPA: MoxR family ATPase [Thermoanaerobaculia bacterium]|nr:MoxR family ATPase [Thermoanaerobaculia bacterium]HXT51895.1 MoxR family ATPase [Thermoanaerobaculia bacterium]